MKKLFCLILALVMLCVSALAETEREESPALTREEIEIYLNGLAEIARQEETAAVFYDEITQDNLVKFSGGELIIGDETFTATTAVLGALLGEEQADLRGLLPGASLEEVLAAYPNDNPGLIGSYFDAALYIIGEKPEITVGYILRTGQRVSAVYHMIYSWRPDGVALSFVSYQLKDGFVTDVAVVTDVAMLEEAEALASIQETADMQEYSDYTPYPVSADNGEALAPFEREDLSLTMYGEKIADFLDLSAEAALEAFGPAPVDEWTEDSDGSFLRLLQWEGVSLLLQYDAQRKFVAVDSLTINDETLAGPRDVRVGDVLDGVIFRFRHGETFIAGDTLALYGDGQEAPFGVLSYSPEGAELTYAFALEDGRTVLWHMTFSAGELQTMSLLLR